MFHFLTTSWSSQHTAVVAGVALLALFAWRRRTKPRQKYSSSTEAEQIVQDHVSTRGSLAGRVFIVTGANEGLGFETTRVLALGGAEIVMACRSEEKARTAIEAIHTEAAGKKLNLRFLPLDLSSFASVRRFVDLFKATGLPLHGLVNNAGVFHLPTHVVGEDGFELTWTVNHLSPWLLTYLLAPSLREQRGARVVNVASKMHETARFYNRWYGRKGLPWKMCVQPPVPSEYGPTWAYARTKVCNIMHALELTRQWGPNVAGYSVEPGLVRTQMTRNQQAWMRELTYLFMKPIMKTPAQGAATTVYCLLHPHLHAGGYYADCAEHEPLSGCHEEQNTRALWELSLRCTTGSISDRCTAYAPSN